MIKVKTLVSLSCVFLFSFVVFVVYLMPANMALSLAKPHLPKQLQLGAVSGSLWQGRVSQVQYRDRGQLHVINNLKWQLSALNLLMTQVNAKLTFGNIRDNSQLSGKATVNFGLISQTLTVDNATLRSPIAPLLSQANLPIPVNIKGKVTAKIDHYEMGTPYCTALNGKVTTSRVEIQGLSGWFEIDDLVAQSKCKSGNVALALDGKNDLGLQLDIILAAKQKLTVSGFIKPSANMPKDVHDAMKFLGKADSQGRYAIPL